MITLKSYICGEWKAGTGQGRTITHAVTGEAIANCSTEGLDLKAMLEYGREKGGPALRKLTFPERAGLLKKIAEALNQKLDEFYQIAATYGATKKDAWMDIEGGISTLGVLSSLGRKKLPNSTFLVDGKVAGLSKEGTFVGRHIMVPLEGVAVQINAYNFPAWGMLEKLAPAVLAGVPTIVKPATPTAWLAQRIVEVIVEAGALPEGSLQVLCGSAGDLLDHLTCQDLVSFTGSAHTGQKIKSHPQVVSQSVRVNMEADSLNAIVLGPDVDVAGVAFTAFVKEVVREMTFKAGQKCTAIRRIIVPKAREEEVVAAIKEKLEKTVVGDPAQDGVRMGPLVDQSSLQTAREGIGRLEKEASIVHGNPQRSEFEGGTADKGAFLEPILLHCTTPMESKLVHEVEVFGPVATVMGYEGTDQAVALARKGGGSLVASAYTNDDDFATQLAMGMAPYHGRLLLMSEGAVKESTGHGVVMPHLIHGGPGRAGGGEELGGLRSVHHYLQRVALQGTPERLEKICQPALSE